MAKILIIDDDDMICRALRQAGERLGHTAFEARTLTQGVAAVARHAPDVVFLDVYMPDGNGLDYLPEIRGALSNPEVIIITGVGDAQGAELAIKSGAWDYLQKPFSTQELQLQMNRLAEYRERKSCAKRAILLDRKEVVGTSPAMMACLEQVAQCANSDANVMITGETGTGKELIARIIHQNSDRASANFVVVDCTVLPEQLVESVLFGHIKGAFTGATHARDGLIQQADGGTLFLDEIGDLNLSLQKAFLRVLQERRFRPVGSSREIGSNFRLISATHRNLDAMAASGGFREDLLFRMRTFAVEIPPLRERQEDIREIVQHYIHRICKSRDMEIKGFSPEFMEILESHDWPGNVRELVSTVEKAIFVEPDNPILYPTHLPDAIRIRYIQSSVIHPDKEQPSGGGAPIGLPNADALQRKRLPSLRSFREAAIERAEKEYLNRLLAISEGSPAEACRLSGLSRARLYALLKKHDLPRFNEA